MGRTFLDNNPRTSTPNYSQNNNVDLASCHDASFRTMFLFVCLDDDIIGSRRCFRTWERNKLRYQNLCTIGMSSFRSMLSRMLETCDDVPTAPYCTTAGTKQFWNK